MTPLLLTLALSCSVIDVWFDGDHDGWSADEDCDDEDPSVHPGADEYCNDLDDDCDGTVDENALDAVVRYPDADGDGYGDGSRGLIACEHSASYVDDNSDCDDFNRDVHPAAYDIPFDGIDQDCSGRDSGDGDHDGYDSVAIEGGDDCDDTNPSIHPGGLDWLNNGVDEDCDGSDATEAWEMEDAPYSIVGREGYAEYVGEGMAVCDLDGDGYDDLILGAPEGNDYHGEVGVFFGSGSSSWSPDMQMSDADAYLTDASFFIGAMVSCGDLDGDGWPDIVASRSECAWVDAEVESFGIAGWYGGENVWSSPQISPDFELSYDLGATNPYRNDRPIFLGDIDGDGASEILVAMLPQSVYGWSGGTDACGLWVVPGNRYSGSGDLDDEVWDRYECTEPTWFGNVDVGDDFNGDGINDIIIGDGDLAEDCGLLGLISTYSSEEPATERMRMLFHTSFVGSQNSYFGGSSAFADIDLLDGIDVVVGAQQDSTEAANGGALYFISDLGSVLDENGLRAVEVANAVVRCNQEDHNFGYNIISAGDLNGDGFGDLLVAETSGQFVYTERTFHLLSGALLSGVSSSSTPAEVDILTWNTVATPYVGLRIGSGDFDGDGHADIAFSAPYWPPGSERTGAHQGKVYMYLTSDYGL